MLRAPTFRTSAAAAVAVVVLFGAACTESPDDGGPPEGYLRLEPPTITVEPGTSNQWVQYVTAPFEQDMDIIDLIGDQGSAGHHAILYASPNPQPIGTTREWTQVDQITDRFVGGIGGSGGEPVHLPAGAVFRIPAGYALYMNTHYLNVTDQPIEGWSYIDVKLEPASPERIAVGMFANSTLVFSVPPDQRTTVEPSCVTQRDLDLVMFTNHLHEYGTAARTAVVDGVNEDMIKDDPVWSPEWTANPNFDTRTLTQPIHIPAGTTLRTSCTWDNTSNQPLAFPDEMCAFFAFHLSGGDMTCTDGQWRDERD